MIWTTIILIGLAGYFYFLYRKTASRYRKLEAVLFRFESSDNFIDELTGVGTTKALMPCLTERINVARMMKVPLTCLLIDVDNFKQINDSLGMKIGDQALKIIAGLIQSELRGSDRILRYRIGDEFLVIAFNASGRDATFSLGERLRSKVIEFDWSILSRRNFISPSISIGVSECRLDLENTPEIVLKNVERALYEAKKRKNCVKLAVEDSFPGN